MKRTVIVLLAAALAILLAAPASAESVHPTAVGHRGTFTHPENTNASIRAAARQGATIVEVDVRRTADRYLRGLHDTLDSTTTCSGRIEDTLRAELADCRATTRWPDLYRRSAERDGRYRIPSLRSMIDTAADAGVGLILDVKSGYKLPRLRRQLDRSGDAVAVQVRGIRRVRWLLERTDHQVGYCCRWPGDIGVEVLGAMGASHVSIPLTEVTEARVALAHSHGLQVHGWTLRLRNALLPEIYRDPGEAPHQYGEWRTYYGVVSATGLDSIHTDEPGKLPQ